MNLNHDPDKHVIDQIDKLLETNQPIGNALLDDLATTRPIANPTFQNALEERLVARFEQHKQGEAMMVSSTSYIPMPAPRRNWLSLTLLTALLVVAIAGIMLINGIDKSPTPNEIALAQPTVTTNAEKTIMVIPRIHFVEVNTTVQEGHPANILFSFFYLSKMDNSPISLIKPESEILPVAENIDVTKVVQDSITVSVTHEQSILIQWALDSKLALILNTKMPPITPTSPITGDAIVNVPPSGNRIVNIPLSSIKSGKNVERGTSVNIIAICAYIPETTSTDHITELAKTDCAQPKETTVVSSGLVVLPVLKPNDGSYPVFSIAVDAGEETLLIDMINAGMLFNVAKSATSNQPTPTPVPLPTGKVSVDIPLTNISTIQESNGGVQVGDYVDAIASLKVEDINSTAPANIQQLVTTQALPSGSQIIQRVIRTALVINLSQKENRLTLAVSPTEAILIRWILNTHLSLKLRRIPTNDSPNMLVPPPNYAVNLKLDSVSHWATDDLQVGDTVDVVVGLVLGTGQTLKLEFKPYGEYGWVDPLSHGTQSAQMYIPSIPYSPSGAIFVRRIIQNAVVTGVSYGVDGAGKQSGAIAITLEIQSDTASTQAGRLKDYVDAGMSYLIVKH